MQSVQILTALGLFTLTTLPSGVNLCMTGKPVVLRDSIVVSVNTNMKYIILLKRD